MTESQHEHMLRLDRHTRINIPIYLLLTIITVAGSIVYSFANISSQIQNNSEQLTIIGGQISTHMDRAEEECETNRKQFQDLDRRLSILETRCEKM